MLTYPESLIKLRLACVSPCLHLCKQETAYNEEGHVKHDNGMPELPLRISILKTTKVHQTRKGGV